MKKLIAGMISLVLVLGIGTVVYAEQMMPSMMSSMMKKMHPNLTNEQMQEMHDACKTTEADMHSTHHI